MSLRSKNTNSKQFKTKEVYDDRGISYLIWDEYPEWCKLRDDTEYEGTRIWISGTSKREQWQIDQIHQPGDDMFPKGGITAMNRKKFNTVDLYFEEVILHPQSKIAKKLKKEYE